MRTCLVHLLRCLRVCIYLAGCTWGPLASGQTNAATQTSSIELGAPLPSGHPYPQTSVIPAGVDSPSAPYPGEAEQKPATGHPHKNGEWVLAPIPFSNQAIHFGVVPVAQYVFRVDPADKESPPSFVAAAGNRGHNGARGLSEVEPISISSRIDIASQRFTDTAASAMTSTVSALRPARENSSPYARLFRLFDHLYLGPRFNYRNLSAGLDESSDSQLPPSVDPADLGSHFTEFSLGPKLLHDTRNDVFYPTTGHSFQFDADLFHAERTSAVFPDKTENYQNYKPAYNHYLPLTPKQMLAVRGMICTVQGSAPFFDLCQFGMQSDIRGYQPGRYRDRRMFAAQAEYRNATTKRIGFVIFFGIGEVAHNWSAFTASGLLPAGGPGLRINMSKKQRINMRIDTGYGKDGWSWNCSLGEAF